MKKKILGIALASSIALQANAFSLASAFQAVSSLALTWFYKPMLINKRTSIKTKLSIGACFAANLYIVHIFANNFRHPKQGFLRHLQPPTWIKPSLKHQDNAFYSNEVEKKIEDTKKRITKGKSLLKKIATKMNKKTNDLISDDNLAVNDLRKKHKKLFNDAETALSNLEKKLEELERKKTKLDIKKDLLNGLLLPI